MGKYMRKCRGISEVAAYMEMAHVGVRTRARALAMAMAASSGNRTGGKSNFPPTSLVHLGSRRRPIVTTPLNSGPRAVSDDRCSSPRSDRLATSCCSSNASSSQVTDSGRFKIRDPEENESVRIDTHCRGRRENTPSSEMEAESGDVESYSEETAKMPSEAEIEEFFAAEEKDLEKQFREKYNFDFVNFVPLEGRYEWVRVSPEEENQP